MKSRILALVLLISITLSACSLGETVTPAEDVPNPSADTATETSVIEETQRQKNTPEITGAPEAGPKLAQPKPKEPATSEGAEKPAEPRESPKQKSEKEYAALIEKAQTDDMYKEFVAKGGDPKDFVDKYMTLQPEVPQINPELPETNTVFRYHRDPKDENFYKPGIIFDDQELSSAEYGEFCVIALELVRKQVEDQSDAKATLEPLAAEDYQKFSVPVAYVLSWDGILTLNLKFRVDYSKSGEFKYVLMTVPLAYNAEAEIGLYDINKSN